jgi:hypothetical protein
MSNHNNPKGAARMGTQPTYSREALSQQAVSMNGHDNTLYVNGADSREHAVLLITALNPDWDAEPGAVDHPDKSKRLVRSWEEHHPLPSGMSRPKTAVDELRDRPDDAPYVANSVKQARLGLIQRGLITPSESAE